MDVKAQIIVFIKIIVAVILIGIFAQIEIELPLNEAGISISGQTFAVLLVGFLLGSSLGSLAIILYTIVGVMGAPVFSGGASGVETFLGPSMGYLVGFVLGAYVAGRLAERGWHDKLWKCIIVMMIGTFVILFCGVIRLTFIFGIETSLEVGMYPFLSGGLIKTTLGGLVAYFIYPLFNKQEKIVD